MDYLIIGAEIRMRRKERRWSQEKLGAMVGLSQKQVSKIETYGTDSLWKLKALAEVFEITVDELINPELWEREVSLRKLL